VVVVGAVGAEAGGRPWTRLVRCRRFFESTRWEKFLKRPEGFVRTRQPVWHVGPLSDGFRAKILSTAS